MRVKCHPTLPILSSRDGDSLVVSCKHTKFPPTRITKIIPAHNPNTNSGLHPTRQTFRPIVRSRSGAFCANGVLARRERWSTRWSVWGCESPRKLAETTLASFSWILRLTYLSKTTWDTPLLIKLSLRYNLRRIDIYISPS